MTLQRQKQVLAVLLLVLVAASLRSFLKVGGPRPTGGDRPARYSRPELPRGPVEPAVDIVELRLQDLEKKPGEYQPGRDPFRFQRAERKPPPPPKPPPPKPKETPKPAPPRPATPAKPRPPEPNFVFLGSFGPEDRRIAVFSDKTDIFNVIEGDTFKEAFVVRKVGYESADIGWVHFPDEPARRLAAGG